MGNNIIVNESAQTLRALGRRALMGNWGIAIGGFVLYMLLLTGPVFLINEMFGSGGLSFDYGSTNQFENYRSLAMSSVADKSIANIYTLLVSGPLSLGLVIFIGSVFRREDPRISQVFNGFERFLKAFLTYFVMSFFIFLWSLLLIIPGIIASYRYSMTFYILMDNPEIGVMEAINASKEMMQNNKWKLFSLHLSFIGWFILAMMTFGLGIIFLGPYIETSMFAFYEIANGNLKFTLGQSSFMDGKRDRDDLA
ncbi:MAG: DUF975 family protein [Anaerovoracaceae bacterium]|jgi:uncharacterized membrane protein